MAIPRSGEITAERVRRFAGEIGGIGVAAGIGFGRLMFGTWRSDLEFYAISGLVIALLLVGGYRLRRWPPVRF